jgi:carbamoyl-phosphate synthase large subunit
VGSGASCDGVTDVFNVLISSAGRRVGLLRAFREALRELGLDGHVLAADVSDLSPAFHLADAHFLVPPCTSPEFVPALSDLCAREGIRLVVPTIDPELPVLAEHREAFAENGTTVAISSPEVIRIGWDKGTTNEWLRCNGFPTVRQVIPGVGGTVELPFPLVVKPRRGSAAVGVRVVSDDAELQLSIRNGDVVVQELAPGVEHTLDVFVDRSGTPMCAVPRRRIEVRAGEVSKGRTLRCEPLIDLASRICEALPGAYGVITIQVFLEEDSGEMNVIEINPRFGGGFPLAWEAGARYPTWLIQDVLGRTPDVRTDWRDGLVMLRYDDAVFVNEGDLRP